MANSTLWGDAAAATRYTVHLGTWTNWSRGQVMGATLTTTRQYGNLFIAFTAFFVGFVASRSWKIVCLASHRYYSSPQKEDVLHHQRQAMLRNSGSSLEGLWMFTRLAWAWRHSARRCLLRMLPAILTASFLLASFSIAGGFSSQISSAVGNDVLLDGSDCGVLTTEGAAKTVQAASILYSDMAQKIGEAANYAQQCYSSSRSGMLDCTSFVVDHLSSAADTQAPCPFPEANMCREQTSNLRLDTGLLDSSEFFGLNAPKSQRIFFRNTLECAPLVTEPFSQGISTSVNNYTVYNYGPNFLGQDYTYQVETVTGQYDRQGDNSLRTNGANFILNTFSSYPENGSTATSSHFIPIPELYTDDGDLHLIFLQGNGVYFYENTTDPWYRATQFGGLRFMGGSPDGPNSTQIIYRPEEASSPLACVERYQFCNANRECGPLAGKQAITQAGPVFNMSAFDIYNDIVPNDPVASRFYWFYLALFTMATDLDVMLKNLGPKAVLSQQSLFDGLVGPLPDDQWQIDVKYWWAIRLASIQAAFVDTSVNRGNTALQAYRIRPYNSYMQDMCDNQKIKSTDYTSFSLFGLYFTYITGLVIVITSYTIEPVIAWLYRRDQARKLTRGEYKYLEWTSNGTLQLQRLAYQGIDPGKWSGYTDDIPMTEAGALLGGLTQCYPEVPRDQEEGLGSTAGKTHDTVIVQTVSSAGESSEAVMSNSNADGAAPTLVSEAGGSDLARGSVSSLGDGDVSEGEWGHQNRAVGLETMPTSGADPVSPISPLPTQFEATAHVPSEATVTTTNIPQQRGASGSDQVIRHH